MCVTAWTNCIPCNFSYCTLSLEAITANSCKHVKPEINTSMLAFSLSCINTSLQCGANSTSHDRKHLTTHAPILFWFAFPSFFTKLEFFMCPFFTIFFFAWHLSETLLFLYQTPLKPRVFTSEVSRTQHPARCRSWSFFISLWILGNNHAWIARPALARAPWQWVSCTRKHQRCNSRSSLSRQRTLKISLELPGAHSLALFLAIKFHHKNICKTRIPSAVRATHCGKLHVWFSRLEAFRSSCCKASSQEGHIDKEEAMARGSKTGLSCPQAMQRWFSSASVTRNKWWQRASNSFMVATSMMRVIVGKILLPKVPVSQVPLILQNSIRCRAADAGQRTMLMAVQQLQGYQMLDSTKPWLMLMPHLPERPHWRSVAPGSYATARRYFSSCNKLSMMHIH